VTDAQLGLLVVGGVLLLAVIATRRLVLLVGSGVTAGVFVASAVRTHQSWTGWTASQRSGVIIIIIGVGIGIAAAPLLGDDKARKT
jgi:hypothetical protein